MHTYLESMKMSIIGRKLGKCQKHNKQILENNRLIPIPNSIILTAGAQIIIFTRTPSLLYVAKKYLATYSGSHYYFF